MIGTLLVMLYKHADEIFYSISDQQQISIIYLDRICIHFGTGKVWVFIIILIRTIAHLLKVNLACVKISCGQLEFNLRASNYTIHNEDEEIMTNIRFRFTRAVFYASRPVSLCAGTVGVGVYIFVGGHQTYTQTPRVLHRQHISTMAHWGTDG